MFEVVINIMHLIRDNPSPNLAFCFTSNGVVKKDGSLVMGAGIAKQFRDRFPGIDKHFGASVSRWGNVPFCIVSQEGHNIISFPTKHNWRDKSDPALIEKSTIKLQELTHQNGFDKVYLPRPGVGLGGLDWKSQVKPILEAHLDDRFYICSLK